MMIDGDLPKCDLEPWFLGMIRSSYLNLMKHPCVIPGTNHGHDIINGLYPLLR